MNNYYVEITRKAGCACVFSGTIQSPLAVTAKATAWKMAEIEEEDRYLYNMYVEII